MTTKFKKLLCSLLSAAMLIGTANVIGFADADKEETGTEAEDTVSVEATAEPETYDYESDTYYQKAVALTTALGIFEGKDDGELHPESVVTRAEMATIVLRMLDISNYSTYADTFTDVDSSHWAANIIQSAKERAIINGFDDGTFVPDGSVTTTQIAKMLVCAANYESAAEYNGGYPQGYLLTASKEMDLFDGCTIKDNNAGCERGNVIKMCYNALIGPYNLETSSEGNEITYSDAYTWAKDIFDVIDAKGLLIATHNTSITSDDPIEGRVIIESDSTTDEYDCTLTDIDDLVGTNVLFYYKDTYENGKEVIAILPNSSKTTEVVIDPDDIKSLSGFDTYKGTISMDTNSKTYKCTDATVIYNGLVITPVIYEQYKSSDTTRFKSSFNEFLLPECGEIKLVDNDSDNNYDIVYVNSIETFIVSSATNSKIVGLFGYYDDNGVGQTYSSTLDIENNNNDKTITIMKNDIQVKGKNLSKDDVVSLKRSVDDTVLNMTVSSDTLTGTVQSTGTNAVNGCLTINIAGETYDVAAVAYTDAMVGIDGTFYFDTYGRIARIDSSSAGLSGAEKYGWIMKAYDDDAEKDGVQVQIFGQDNEAHKYSLASTVKYWAPGDTAVSSLTTSTQVGEDLMKRVDPDYSEGFLTDSNNGYQIRLVKYSTNSKDEITKLYCATEATDDSGSAMTISTTNYKNTASSGNLIGKYYLQDGMVRFYVPGITATGDTTEMGKTTNYTADTATASTYLNSQEGVDRDFIIGQFKDSKANVLVEFTTPASEAASVSDYGTANNNPCFIVDRIATGIDADEETVYTIFGHTSGGEVSYTTTQNTLIRRISSSGPVQDKNTYAVDSKWGWDAKNGAVNSSYGTEISDYVKKGDVYGVQTNSAGASVLIRMVGIDDLYTYFVEGDTTNAYTWFGTAAFSETRDSIAVGAVTSAELSSMGAILSTEDRTISVDADRYFDVVTYNINTGEIKYNEDDYTISDVGVWDSETKTGDIAFIRSFKGSLQNVMLIRFED